MVRGKAMRRPLGEAGASSFEPKSCMRFSLENVVLASNLVCSAMREQRLVGTEGGSTAARRSIDGNAGSMSMLCSMLYTLYSCFFQEYHISALLQRQA